MTYLMMSLPFLTAGLLSFAAGAMRARSRHAAGGYVRAWAVTTAVLVLLTVVFDNLMMAAGLFDYGPGLTSGIRLGLMPVEDLLYPIVGALLLSGVTELLPDTRERRVRS